MLKHTSKEQQQPSSPYLPPHSMRGQSSRKMPTHLHLWLSIVVSLAVIALALGIFIPAHGAVPLAFAQSASSPPITLVVIDTRNVFSNQSQQVFHRGDPMYLSADVYNHLGGTYIVTLHRSAYHGHYSLYDYTTAYIMPSDVGDHWFSFEVDIPLNAPLGTYHYSFTLQQSGYPDENLSMQFKVVK